ncbi:MAG: PEGA domain-containing protein [Thermoprotei archaeon]
MKFRYIVAFLLLVSALAISATSVTQVRAQGQPLLYSVNMTVYSDGSVLVSQVWYVLSPLSFLQLNGSSQSSLVLVYGFNGSRPAQPLPFNYSNGGVSVNSKGYIKVGVLYSSSSMTSKYGTIWSVSWYFSAPVRVELPPGAELTSWSVMPTAITTVNGSVLVLMPAGAGSLNYTIPQVPGYVIGTVYPSSSVLVDGRKISSGTSFNLTLLPGQYELSLEAPGYFPYLLNVTVGPGQVTLLKPVHLKSTVKEVKLSLSSPSAGVGQSVIIRAEVLSFNLTPMSGQTVEFFLNGSRIGENVTSSGGIVTLSYRPTSPGIFIVRAVSASNSSIASSAELKVTSQGLQTYVYAAALAAVAAAAALAYGLKRRRHSMPEELDPEEKMILQYLSTHGGKAFQSELLTALPIPKTTLWRNVMSLQEKGYVNVTKVGGLNLVTLSKKA